MDARVDGGKSGLCQAIFLIMTLISLLGSAPCEAEEAILKVERQACYCMSSDELDIYVNDVKVGSVKDGEKRKFVFTIKPHGKTSVFSVNAKLGVRSPVAEFTASDGDLCYIRIGAVRHMLGEHKLFINYEKVECAFAEVLIRVPNGATVLVKAGDEESEMSVHDGVCRFSTRFKIENNEYKCVYSITVKYSLNNKIYNEVRKVHLIPGIQTGFDLTDIVEPRKSNRTLHYWKSVNLSIICSHNCKKGAESHKNCSFLDYVKDMKNVIADIDALSVRGVDEEAIRVIHDGRKYLVSLIEIVEKHSGIMPRIEGGARGALGAWNFVTLQGSIDGVFAKRNEGLEDKRKLQEQYRDLVANLNKVRALLISRYDEEFPESVFDMVAFK